MIDLRAFAASACLALAVAGAAASAQAAPDFTGAWVVTEYSPALKTIDGRTPPLLPEAAKLYAERRAAFAKGDLSFDPVAKCSPLGMPRMLTAPYAFEIAQNDTRLIQLFEWNRMYRRVELGPPSLFPDDLQISGIGRGRWEGDALVVEVTSIDTTLMDAEGMPHSDKLKITEHYRLLPNGNLENRLRIEDPETFSQPWETAVQYRRLAQEVGETICVDRPAGSPAIEPNHLGAYR